MEMLVELLAEEGDPSRRCEAAEVGKMGSDLGLGGGSGFRGFRTGLMGLGGWGFRGSGVQGFGV